MSHSLIGAHRNSHFKIMAVALVIAIVLIAVGLSARMDDSESATAQLNANSPVLKVGTSRDGSTIR
jgi:hypothetical protein